MEHMYRIKGEVYFPSTIEFQMLMQTLLLYQNRILKRLLTWQPDSISFSASVFISNNYPGSNFW